MMSRAMESVPVVEVWRRTLSIGYVDEHLRVGSPIFGAGSAAMPTDLLRPPFPDPVSPTPSPAGAANDHLHRPLPRRADVSPPRAAPPGTRPPAAAFGARR
jgi:hypothetical protein